jgi:hypothetical protein
MDNSLSLPIACSLAIALLLKLGTRENFWGVFLLFLFLLIDLFPWVLVGKELELGFRCLGFCEFLGVDYHADRWRVYFPHWVLMVLSGLGF